MGDKAPSFERDGRGPRREGGPRYDGVLGKRRRDAEDASSDDSDIPDEVKRIPMPRDTPPPIPKEILDEWFAKRRAKRSANANMEPLGEKDRLGDKGDNGERREHAQQPERPIAPVPVSKTVYESPAILRDLRKEAVSAFMPTVVRAKLQKAKGQGGLLQPEEADRLEREGYLKTAGAVASSQVDMEGNQGAGNSRPRPRPVIMEEVEDED